MTRELVEQACPNCGGEMLTTTGDEYCIECVHEGRI